MMGESSADEVGGAAAPLRDVRSMRHGFSSWSAAQLSLASMRPLVGIAAAAYLISSGGLGSWLAVLLLLLVLLVVASVFGELASRWPLEGSIYAWSRQLVGPRVGFLAGWAHLWSYVLFMAALSFFDTQRIFFLLGLPPPGHLDAALANAVLIAAATALNATRRVYFKVFALTAAAVSVLGVTVYATILLVSHRQRSFAALFELPAGGGLDWAWFSGPFLVVLAFASSFALRGFEMPAEVAEEVRDPRRNVPRVMIWTLLAGGAITLYGVIALSMAVPDVTSVGIAVDKSLYAGSLASTVRVALGDGAAQLLAVLFIVATFCSATVFQLAASRTLWTMARDRELPGHAFLVELTAQERLPRNALLVVGGVGAVLPFLIQERTAFLLQLASCAPLLLAFLVPVLGLIALRWRGGWQPGPWSLGRWGTPAAVVAALSLAALSLNALWPRSGGALNGTGWMSWVQEFVLLGILGSGVLLLRWAARRRAGAAGECGPSDAPAHERVRLRYSGRCIFCSEVLAAGQEVYWDRGAYVTLCVACHSPANLATLALASRVRGVA